MSARSTEAVTAAADPRPESAAAIVEPNAVVPGFKPSRFTSAREFAVEASAVASADGVAVLGELPIAARADQRGVIRVGLRALAATLSLATRSRVEPRAFLQGVSDERLGPGDSGLAERGVRLGDALA